MKACRKNRPHLLAALLLIMAGNVIAVPNINHPGRFKVNPLHLESGPSRGLVNAVQRDATGYLWVGTDNGLMRYDGYNYTVFNNILTIKMYFNSHFLCLRLKSSFDTDEKGIISFLMVSERGVYERGVQARNYSSLKQKETGRPLWPNRQIFFYNTICSLLKLYYIYLMFN